MECAQKRSNVALQGRRIDDGHGQPLSCWLNGVMLLTRLCKKKQPDWLLGLQKKRTLVEAIWSRTPGLAARSGCAWSYGEVTENGVHDSNAWSYEGPAKVRLAREGSFPRAWSGVGRPVESGWDVVRGHVCGATALQPSSMETSDEASPKDKRPSGCTGRQGQPDPDGAGHEGEGKIKTDDHGRDPSTAPTWTCWRTGDAANCAMVELTGPAASGR